MPVSLPSRPMRRRKPLPPVYHEQTHRRDPSGVVVEKGLRVLTAEDGSAPLCKLYKLLQ